MTIKNVTNRPTVPLPAWTPIPRSATLGNNSPASGSFATLICIKFINLFGRFVPKGCAGV
jgi:hypothetical protein